MTAPDNIGRNAIRGVAILIAATLTCALIVWGGAILAGKMLATLPDASAALGETLASGAIFGALLAAGLLGGKLSRVHAGSLGPAPSTRLAQGLLIGLIGLLAATSLAAMAGSVHLRPGTVSVGLLAWGSVLILLQSTGEEVFFRGWLQPALVASWGKAGIVATAIAFAALHMLGSSRNIVSITNLFLGGMWFGLLARRYQGLAAAIGAHFSWNWAEQLLVGLDPNPGVGSFGSIWDAELLGPSLWGGSVEGLNASVAMTFALAMLLAPLLIVPANDRLRPALHRSGPAPA